jgi:hypothetical protein
MISKKERSTHLFGTTILLSIRGERVILPLHVRGGERVSEFVGPSRGVVAMVLYTRSTGTASRCPAEQLESANAGLSGSAAQNAHFLSFFCAAMPVKEDLAPLAFSAIWRVSARVVRFSRPL